jgi:hypothetical protein
MATRQTGKRWVNKERPWRARRKRDGIEFYLGSWATREDAERVEQEFDKRHPSKRGTGMRTWRNKTGWGELPIT